LGKRITDSQRSFRSVDIEEVGDNRHTTFFEMLGNWSLGDYFKAEQIPWMFEFLIKQIGLNPSRLYVTVFRGKDAIERDDEAVRLWKEQFASVGIDARAVDDAEEKGMQGGRIFFYNEKKNWWSRSGEPKNMPTGEPGGPDSEMFFDFGAERGMHEHSPWKDQPCHVNCDCGRFLEIGNNVFMEYIKTDHGFEKLAQRNVDFGGGLERIAAASNDHPDVFMIDVFQDMRTLMEEMCGQRYESNSRSFRIVLDHLRAATFLIADGAPPSNKDQGYFTRRMLRRAIVHGDKLGMKDGFCSTLADTVIRVYASSYPSLPKQRTTIVTHIEAEEAQFRKTLTKGAKELSEYLKTHAALDGAKAFYFFETYGFPLELTQELLAESGKTLADPEGFESAKAQHSDDSRIGSAGKFKGGLADQSTETTKLHTATHLLNAALRKVLGDHVYQKGSNITAERLRFDFSHPEKMTPEQLKEVQKLVNEAIAADLPITYHVTSVEAAKAEGAIGVFDAKYGAEVKVYKVGPSTSSGRGEWSLRPFSLEICGGPHIAHTGLLGSLIIQKEESSSSGVRRIKAVLQGGPDVIEVAKEAA